MLSTTIEMELESQEEETMAQEMEDTDEEELELCETEKPRFFIVEMSQIEALLNRCPKCGSLPGSKSTGKPRNIIWKQNGKLCKRS